MYLNRNQIKKKRSNLLIIVYIYSRSKLLIF
jgi:hypothetical protein